MMQIPAGHVLPEKKAFLKEILNCLLSEYPYASVLGSESDGKQYRISKQGVSCSSFSMVKEIGYVIRVFDGESWAEYAWNDSQDLTPEGICGEIRKNLISIKDRLPEGLSVNRYALPEEEETVFEKSSSCEIFPEDLPDGRVLSRLQKIRDHAMAQRRNLADFVVRCNYQVYHKIFLSPKKDMTQNILWTEAAVMAFGSRGERMETAYKAKADLCGLEILDRIEEQVPAVFQELDDLLVSEPMIPGEYDCICAPDVTGLLVHEAFGHGVEMDMFQKDRALARSYIGKQVASPLVTMHDGAGTALVGPASYFFDDDGVPAHDTIVIEKGILKQGICDSQAAAGLRFAPTGNGRREKTDHKAYTRMTNTYFEGGTDTLPEMIASVKYGFLLENSQGGMEDPKNWGIQCMAGTAKEIRDGKLTGKVFSPITMTGYVPDLLKSITMMSETPELFGSGWCGKGHKEWAKVSLGGPYIKARIRLG